MTIRIRRARGYYGGLRALNIRLEGEKVGHVGAGDSIELRGNGAEQVLTFHMDWMASRPVTVRDPDPELLEIEVRMPSALAGMLRTFAAPRSAIKVQLPG
jgi:hypothetical protein